MKTFLYAGAVALLSTALFSSCQKELDWSQANSPQADSNLLRKLIMLDTALPAGMDTIQKTVIEYDNQGRVVQVNRSSKDQSAPPTGIFPFFDSLTYYYNGNDTLPFKAIKSYTDFLTIGKDTGFFFYSAVKVIKDSIRSSYLSVLPPPGPPVEAIKVNFFTDNGNTAQVITLFSQTLNPPVWPPPCPATTNFQKTYVNGNIAY